MVEAKAIGFLLNGISLSPDRDEREACIIAEIEMKRAGISPARLRFDIYKKSIDARKKDDVRIVYSVAVRSLDGESVPSLPKGKYQTSVLYDNTLELQRGSKKMSAPPLVVGMGPAGLFCALLLAEEGYAPIIIDRGDCIEERCRIHRAFVETGVLDTESNKIGRAHV